MKKFLQHVNPILLDLIAGCLICGVVGEIVILILWITDLITITYSMPIGYILGILLAIFLAIHMDQGIADSLYMDEDNARKNSLKSFAFRAFVMLVALAIVLTVNLFHPITFAIGLMSLKVAAYLQPFTHKFIISKIIT